MKYIAFTLSFFSLFVILEGTSCKHANKYVKETQMLDSMNIFVAKADSAVKTIDSVKISNYANQVEKDNELLQMEHVDSMSPAATSIFRKFNAARWSLLIVAGKKGPLIKELEKSETQLKHLSHDLQHGLITNADSVGYYVAFETKRASELVETSNLSIGEMNRQIPIYNTLLPQTDSLMNLLKEHKKF